jgi:hypothetical protein
MTLVLSGEDEPHLSEYPFASKLRESGFFHTIFFEGVDAKLPDDGSGTRFETYPKGFDMHYMLGREEDLIRAAKSARLDTKRGVLASYGVRPTRRERLWVTEDSQALDRFLGAAEFVNKTTVMPSEYFSALAQHRFLLAPMGRGVQSPKFVEAVLLMTIPITKRYGAFEDLQAYGMPIVLVDSWGEVTPQNLDRWWAELSPRLEAARWIATNQGVDSLLQASCTTQ